MQEIILFIAVTLRVLVGIEAIWFRVSSLESLGFDKCNNTPPYTCELCLFYAQISFVSVQNEGIMAAVLNCLQSCRVAL